MSIIRWVSRFAIAFADVAMVKYCVLALGELGDNVKIPVTQRLTPKHGSWLDMAESELSVLSRQCLARRIPNKTTTLTKEVAARQRDRNNKHKGRLAVHHHRRRPP
jgi:hypothetical protein